MFASKELSWSSQRVATTYLEPQILSARDCERMESNQRNVEETSDVLRTVRPIAMLTTTKLQLTWKKYGLRMSN